MSTQKTSSPRLIEVPMISKTEQPKIDCSSKVTQVTKKDLLYIAREDEAHDDMNKECYSAKED